MTERNTERTRITVRRRSAERERKIKAVIIVTITVIAVIIAALFIKKFAPSGEMVDLNEYYNVEQDHIMIVLQNNPYEEQGLYIDGRVYIDIDTVEKYLNSRFYWDANENILIYTTPTEIIKAEVGSKDYYVNKSKASVDYQIVKTEGEKAYVALDYIEQYSNVQYEIFENPNRIVFNYKWNEEYEYAVATKKNAAVRKSTGIKYPILTKLEKGEKVLFADLLEGEPDDEKFVKVMTIDGIMGYVERKHLSERTTEVLTSDYKEPVYPNISKDYEINLVWHQVTNQEANDGLLNLLSKTKGVTTVSPTWFTVADEKGGLTSLASETYVTRAHNAGVEVWALCGDVDAENVSMYNLLSYTSRREKLINNIIANAIKYNLDGINIDFEHISKESGPHFVQFIRELSVKCRSNGIILSIDNYAPGFTGYYNRKEQGIVADYVITMAYDEHTNASETSGSVASYNYVKEAVENTLKEVPAEKTIIAVPFYTRLWKETTEEDGTVTITSQAYGMQQALNVLTDHGAEPVWDETTKQYYGEYESNGVLYKVWLEEDSSMEAKMEVINEANVAGIAAWKLGLEKASVWNVIIKYVN